MLKKEWFRTILPFLIIWGMCFPALLLGDCFKGNPPADKVAIILMMAVAFWLAHLSRKRWRQLEAEAAETAAAKAESETKAEAKAAAKAKAENAEAEAKAETKAETEG